MICLVGDSLPTHFITTLIRVKKSQTASLSLRDSSRPARPVNFSSGFNHNIPLSSWVEDDENNYNNSDDQMSGKGAADVDVVDGRRAKALVDNANADNLKLHPVSFGQRAAIICNLSVVIGLPKSGLSGNISKLHGYTLLSVGSVGTPFSGAI